MGFLIDTNILSELQKGVRADIGVKSWYVDILLALKDEDSYCVRHPVVLIASASSWC